MKREDLEKIEGLSKEAIDRIMALHGQDITNHQTKLTTAQTELDGLKAQLTEANTTIESFKKLDVDGIKAAADDWKAKAEKATADAAAQMTALKFDHALDGALSGAKAKNSKAVKALLDMELLQKAYDDKTGTIIGFEDHLKPVKEANDYLFESDEKTPVIVKGGNNQSVIGDVVVNAARQAAGLPIGK
jgi:predicted  nucleic acid-binding Zn-ribbon protein